MYADICNAITITVNSLHSVICSAMCNQKSQPNILELYRPVGTVKYLYGHELLLVLGSRVDAEQFSRSESCPRQILCHHRLCVYCNLMVLGHQLAQC